MIEIEVPIRPTPWTAPKMGKRGAFNPRGKDKNFARWLIKNAYRGEPIQGYIALEILFIEEPPMSASKKDKARMLLNEIRPTRCDLTNCVKFIEDCLKNIVFNDDRFVVKNISEKIYGKKEKILIKVYSLEEYNKKCESS